MASINKAILIGNLGRDPEVRYLPDGTAIANLSVATTDKYKDKSGAVQEATEWHRVSFFGRTAEVCGEYLTKGSQIYVEGSIRTRKYTDKDGVDKYATEIRGDRMQMLGGKGGQQPVSGTQRPASNTGTDDYARATGRAAPPPRQASSNGFDDMDDDIPF